MDDRCIALYDSGVGGLILLSALKKLYPKENYVYFSDYENFPYGNKPKAEILRLAEEKTKSILSFSPKAIIFACNTLSTAALDDYSNFPIKVFGVKPIVKRGEKTLIISTRATAESEYVKTLKKEYDLDILAADGLAEEVEAWARGGEKPKAEKFLKGVKRDYDSVVLGCTHYAFLKDEFSSLFPSSVVRDGSDEVLEKFKGWLPTFETGGRTGEILFINPNDKECFIRILNGI